MHNSYDDLRALTTAEPDWYDQNGVPRWGEHSPDKSPDIYADEVVLLEIGCQGCDTRFKVQMTWGMMNLITLPIERLKANALAGPEKQLRLKYALATDITEGSIHYGDPPNAGCCLAGPTMNCTDYRVLEYWRKKDFVWVRMLEFEITLPDEEDSDASGS